MENPNPFLVVDPREQRLVKEIEREQVTHHIDQYQPGSERLERLYVAMEDARRFSWPLDGYQVNV